MRETLSKSKFNPDEDIFIQVKKYTSGAIYTGEWLGGFRHGEGKIYFADGSYYEGEWNLGKAHGKGILKSQTGDSYEGNWYGNMRHG